LRLLCLVHQVHHRMDNLRARSLIQGVRHTLYLQHRGACDNRTSDLHRLSQCAHMGCGSVGPSNKARWRKAVWMVQCSAVQCSVCVFALDRGVDQPPVLCAHEAVLRAMQLRRDACVSLHSLCTHCEIHSPCLIQGELGPASTPLGAPLRWAWIMSVTGRYAPPRRAFWTYRPC
jgi:hypothetical protein